MKKSRTNLKKPERRYINYSKILYMSFICCIMVFYLSMPTFAAATIWEKATEIMKDVYSQILLISTIAAVVTAAVAIQKRKNSR